MSPRPTLSRAAAALTALTAWVVLAGCTGGTDTGTVDVTGAGSGDSSGATALPTADPVDLAEAVSEPDRDSVYPDIGSTTVDALRYDLDLRWEPESATLSGTATITLRPLGRRAVLDLDRRLEVSDVTVEGADARFSHRGQDLRVTLPRGAAEETELVVTYAGEPGPVAAPTRRSDFDGLGWTVTPTGEVWTMQEPYGAHTWYPVNDHPSDKAFYDVRIDAPLPWTGVSNGELVALEEEGERRVTQWHLDSPAASYLMTIGIGDYVRERRTAASGLAVDFWIPRGQPAAMSKLEEAVPALDWLEERLGDYPFSSLGFLVTPSMSAMETQTMITLGTNEYVFSPEVLQHELAHQWWGDQVSPDDWRDLMLNEGLVMYLQGLYRSELTGESVPSVINTWREADQQLRDEFGPPGSYDADAFGGSNVYYCIAVMWHDLRRHVGDEVFWELVREWPRSQSGESVSREELEAWLEEQTGEELTAFLDAWMVGDTTPPENLLKETA